MDINNDNIVKDEPVIHSHFDPLHGPNDNRTKLAPACVCKYCRTLMQTNHNDTLYNHAAVCLHFNKEQQGLFLYMVNNLLFCIC